MKFSVTPVKFPNRRGCQLFGMLHEPEGRSHGPAIILLSPGIKSRVAPHRMYVKMADRFCAMGFVVLRMDPEGLGDSEGEIEEYLTADVYGSLELGRLVNDTIDAMDWMQSNRGVGSFILSGLCGGAITGLLAGAMDNRVVSLLGLGITCIVSGLKTDPNRFLTVGQLDSMRKTYLRKILEPASIKRFLTGKTNYRVMAQSLAAPLKKLVVSKKKAKDLLNTDAALHESKNSNLNPLFPEAFFKMASNRKMLLIFSEADRMYWEYQEKFAEPYAAKLQKHQSNVNVAIVKNANHIFSFDEWQQEMLALSNSWISNNYVISKRSTASINA